MSRRKIASVHIYGWFDEGVKSTYEVYCPVCVELFEEGEIDFSAVHHGRKDNLNGRSGHILTVHGKEAYDRFKPEKMPRTDDVTASTHNIRSFFLPPPAQPAAPTAPPVPDGSITAPPPASAPQTPSGQEVGQDATYPPKKSRP